MNMRTCNWKSLTPNHFICPVCRGCGRTRERSTYRVSTLRVHGHRRDAGYRFDGQCADPPYSCVPPPPGDRAPDRAWEPGSILSEPQKAVSAVRGVLPKTDTLTLGLDFPPKNSLMSHSVTVRLSVRQIRRAEGAGNSAAVPSLVLLQMSPTSYKKKHVSPFESSNLVTVPQNYRTSLLRFKKARRRRNGLCF